LPLIPAKSVYPTDSRRSDLAAGTGLHAPKPPIPGKAAPEALKKKVIELISSGE
jgi:hypothetical protein